FLREGRLYLASRRTDLILRGGENVYPAEIERRLEAHEDVLEAGVIGVPDEELGQRVRAVVVLREGKTLTPETLASWVSEGLAYYKVPAEWEIRSDRLPRNATGKVVRHALLSAENPFIEDCPHGRSIHRRHRPQPHRTRQEGLARLDAARRPRRAGREGAP